jgi:HK97 family phage major capsid protein
MLKALMLRRRIDLKKKDLAALREKLEGLNTREAELSQAIEEVETEEQRTAVEEEITAFENERNEAQTGADQLEQEISDLEEELRQEEEAQDTTPPADTGATGGETANTGAGETATENRGGNIPMIRRLKNFTQQEREAFLGNEQVRSFLGEVRTAIAEKRAITGVGLTIPEVMLGLVREEIAANSKLLKFINLRPVGGKGRLNIMGKIPEAVWTEMCANLNELDLAFNQTEVDGYKVGAFIAICNATLEDSDLALAQEIVTAIGIAIAKALDKAILYGTGTKMPVGIITRLACESQPAWWGTNDPAFVDLHTSNIKSINKSTSTGAEFFAALIAELGIAKPVYSGDGLFWVMNRKTHLDIMAKALAFDANGALVANTQLMPIVGGEIVEFEDNDVIADYEIVGGFGGNYLMAERAGVEFASSTEVRFLQDQTVFKGTGRYDGRPIEGKAFVIVNYANSTPTKTRSFAKDWANEEMNALGITAKASASNVGKTVLTVADTLAAENPELYYKVGKVAFNVGDDQPASGFTSLTSGTTEITAAAGKIITVIEVDSDDKVVSVGYVASVPKAS